MCARVRLPSIIFSVLILLLISFGALFGGAGGGGIVNTEGNGVIGDEAKEGTELVQCSGRWEWEKAEFRRKSHKSESPSIRHEFVALLVLVKDPKWGSESLDRANVGFALPKGFVRSNVLVLYTHVRRLQARGA
ncbi:hypothetical protein C8J57DRAFT_1238555 [Mycena rebaudengoi]|nr:hypothetical protein C8J57DRAFT_1238555 [Mycena rebaudengoi]